MVDRCWVFAVMCERKMVDILVLTAVIGHYERRFKFIRNFELSEKILNLKSFAGV